MRRWAILLAGAALWLFLAALPALADGGPHMASANSGITSLTADGCAGCHRAHTAKGEFLINQPTVDGLCLGCHGAVASGATTDVMTGVQYTSGANHATGGTQLGALRDGGFDQARIGTPFRIGLDNGSGAVSRNEKVQVSGTPANVTSAHLVLPENGLVQPGVAWGNGPNGAPGPAPVISLECTSCHNPHGNGKYRILNPIPSATGVDATWTAAIVKVAAATDLYTTAASHGLLVGDKVTVAGSTSASANVTNYYVKSVPTSDGNTFTLSATVGGATLDVLTDGTGGTVTRSSDTATGGVTVTDAPLPAPGDTRNYTVIQVKGTEGTPATYLLYASQVAGVYSPLAGDYMHRYLPWDAVTSATRNMDAPNGLPSTFDAQITRWCASCHTRYYAASEPLTDPADGTVGPAYNTARPGDSVYTYQHRTRPDRACTTCHVAHGTNAVMDGTFSSTYTYPDLTVSASSRLLKIGNRGTCQFCHDPTGTFAIGDQFPVGAPRPSTP